MKRTGQGFAKTTRSGDEGTGGRGPRGRSQAPAEQSRSGNDQAGRRPPRQFQDEKRPQSKYARESDGRNARSSGHGKDATDDRLRKTLDRLLSRAGVESRTVAAEWIRAGRVRVNNRTEWNPDAWVHPDEDRVTLDGRLLRPRDRVYLLLNKPKGYLCTRDDPQGRRNIYGLLTGVKSWVFHVGRLDLDTSGLLILTNDTDLSELMTNPEHRVPKTYLVKASTRLNEEQLEALRNGVMLDDGPTLPAEVRRLRDSEKYTHLEIVLHEGRNRQVRRMLEAVGSKVLKLVRTAIGPIEIAGLEIGKHRPLSNEEIRTLKKLATTVSGHRNKKTNRERGAGANADTLETSDPQTAIRDDDGQEWIVDEDIAGRFLPGDGPEE